MNPVQSTNILVASVVEMRSVRSAGAIENFIVLNRKTMSADFVEDIEFDQPKRSSTHAETELAQFQ